MSSALRPVTVGAAAGRAAWPRQCLRPIISARLSVPGDRADDDVAAVAAVAAVGTAARLILFAAKRDSPAAAVAPFDKYRHPINEHTVGS